jgi:hypothetical protein
MLEYIKMEKIIKISFYRIYYIIGWGIPIVLVLIWSGLTYRAFYGYVCWWMYNFSGLFWVLEGPRLAVILVSNKYSCCTLFIQTYWQYA